MRTDSDKTCVLVFYWHWLVLPFGINWFIQDIWLANTIYPCEHAPWTHPEASCLYLEKLQFLPGGSFLRFLRPESEVCSQCLSYLDENLSAHRPNWNEKKKTKKVCSTDGEFYTTSITFHVTPALESSSGLGLCDCFGGGASAMWHRSLKHRPNSACWKSTTEQCVCISHTCAHTQIHTKMVFVRVIFFCNHLYTIMNNVCRSAFAQCLSLSLIHTGTHAQTFTHFVCLTHT